MEDAETRDQWFDAVHEDRALVTHRTDGAARGVTSGFVPIAVTELPTTLPAAEHREAALDTALCTR